MSSTAPITASFAQKPTNGGTPAVLNISIIMIAANQGLLRLRPEVLDLIAFETFARQQQDHPERPDAMITYVSV